MTKKEYAGNKVVMSHTLTSFPELLRQRGHVNKVWISNAYLGEIINLASFVDQIFLSTCIVELASPLSIIKLGTDIYWLAYVVHEAMSPAHFFLLHVYCFDHVTSKNFSLDGLQEFFNLATFW